VADVQLLQLDRPALFDTGAWTWVRDRRFPELATWFNAVVEAGLVLVCDLVILELTRLAPNEGRVREIADRLDAFEAIPMPSELGLRRDELNWRWRQAVTIAGFPQRTYCSPAQLRRPGWHWFTTTATTSGLLQRVRFAISGWCRTELWPEKCQAQRILVVPR
jgi:hypothetical protein